MLIKPSPYFGKCVVMTTKHAKSIAVAPGFQEILGAAVAEYLLDTDVFGTFSGEVQRQGSAFHCARQKCEWGLDRLNAEFGIASEGRFGPSPDIPFVSAGFEILYFIDRTRNFHLHVSRWCDKTNYLKQTVDSFEELQEFSAKTQFPSHALIVRPNRRRSRDVVFEGIDTLEELELAFERSLARSADGLVRVETDMRAHVNPTRMSEISELACQLAQRLATPCPACKSPGWGAINAERGLRYEYYDQLTETIRHEVFGCVLCDHTEPKRRRDRFERVPQMYCGWGNP